MKTNLYRTGAGLSIILSCMLFATACSKNKDKDPQKSPVEVTGKVVGKGVSTGAVVSKHIGTAGGELRLPDQSLSITIPAGALTAATTVSIEPITNTNVAGLGKAYRLMPHGVHFAKPVTITMSYATVKDSISMPAGFGLSYQGEDGIWRYMASTVDPNAKTVTVQAAHFSDWSGMNWIMLTPRRAIVTEGAEVELKALVFIPVHGDQLQEPVYDEEGYPVGDPQPLASKFIKGWDYTGPGTLIRIDDGYEALYVAPKTIALPFTVPVTCELNSANNHKYLLISNIELRSKDFFEIRIDGGAWKPLACKLAVASGRVSISNSVSDESSLLVIGWPANNKKQYAWVDDEHGQDAVFTYWPEGGTATAPYYAHTYRTDDDWALTSGGGITLTEYGAPGEYVTGTFTVSQSGLYAMDKYQGTHTIEGRFKLKRF